MRHFLYILCYVLLTLLLLLSLSACGSKKERQVAPQLMGLYKQLNESCDQAQVYEKKVVDLNVNPNQIQDSVFTLKDYAKDTLSCPLSKDLLYAYSQYFEQDGLVEYFDTYTSGDTVIGKIKPAYQSSIELQMQKVLKSGEKVLYFESYSSKGNWLYELDLHIKLFFDQNGLYQAHSLDIYNSVPLLKEEFKSRIEGKAQYP